MDIKSDIGINAREDVKQQPLLEVKKLTTKFQTEDGTYTAVEDISFTVSQGETVCIVGESGCGKSVTSLSIMRLIPSPPGMITAGEILLEGKDLLKFSEAQIRQIRGKDITMIFQEPMTSLNPVFNIGTQVAEAFTNHEQISYKEAWNKAIGMLEMVRIPDPKIRVKQYPHELSGGMRQRVMISMALANNPKLIIADEPTTALDVTIQAQILQLMKNLKETLNTAIILITHDLGVVADMADRVIVMYAGEIVEIAQVDLLFASPLHPYTEGLLNSIPRLDYETDHLEVIKGSVPSPNEVPKGCKFHTRCPYAIEKCINTRPILQEITGGHQSACWLAASLSLKGVMS